MSDQQPSQAEGEREEEPEELHEGGRSWRPTGHPSPRQTPSQAEGEREEESG